MYYGTMPGRKLTTVHHVILGCLASFGPQTSYDLKRSSQRITGWMWEFPHTQLYTEPLKLVDAGLVEAEAEEGGRRRRTYSITQAGRDELDRWSAELPDKDPEIRDLAFLKLYFADRTTPERVADLARQQAAMHEARAEWVRSLLDATVDDPSAQHRRRVGRVGLAHAEMLRDFWRAVAEDPSGAAQGL